MGTIWQPDLSAYQGPKYRRVVQALRDAVAEGVLQGGDKLPPVRELAWQIDVTPGTVARAYTILTGEGVLEAAVGRGTFVANCKPVAAPPPLMIDPVPHGTQDVPGPISLYSPGIPDVGHAALIRALLAQVAADPPSGVMHYPSRDGTKPLRSAALQWLAGTPLGPLDQDDIVPCHGGQNGILLVLQTLLKGPSPVVYVEDLCYPGFRRAAELMRAQVVPVRMDGQGIDPDALAQAAAQHGPGVLCTSPEVHNPTTILTPETRRREIVSIGRKFDVSILEDDCYRLGAPQAPSYRMLAPERSWYICSISKSLTPALRIGFAIAPHGQVAMLRRAAEHGFFGVSTVLSDLCAALLTHPQIHDLAGAVEQRFGTYIQSAVNALGSFDLSWRADVPFLWLKLPERWRSAPFCIAAEARGIGIRPAEQFTGRDARAPHAVRLAINATIAPERFERAMLDLRDLLDNPADEVAV